VPDVKQSVTSSDLSHSLILNTRHPTPQESGGRRCGQARLSADPLKLLILELPDISVWFDQKQCTEAGLRLFAHITCQAKQPFEIHRNSRIESTMESEKLS